MRLTHGGNLGIGTTTPYGKLTIWGSDSASSTLAFNVVNNASSTVFAVFDGGNAELSGTLTQNSDRRLKTNIQPLDASSSLSAIDALNPVSFNWINGIFGDGGQLGFIAQDVQKLFPQLVSTTSPTAYTPGGTLGLNYIDLIAPIVGAIQELASELSSIETTIAGFADKFTTQELCVGATCVTPAQFQAMVAASGQSSAAGSNTNDTNGATSTPASLADATNTPPVIQINGDNPAIIQVGATYNDLGATITGPQADLNLGIETYVNGTLVSDIVLDTSTTTTATIDYVVTDQNGLTSTSTRTVTIEPVASSTPQSLPITNSPPLVTATDTATSTATSTSR